MKYLRRLLLNIKRKLFNYEVCVYCGKEIWEGTPKTYNMLNQVYHGDCWDEFQWD